MQSGNYGLFKDAGLPNITGSLNNLIGGEASANTNSSSSSAIYWGNASHSRRESIEATSSNKYGRYDPAFDASKSNSIYGNSTTVQPNTISVYYYMKY